MNEIREVREVPDSASGKRVKMVSDAIDLTPLEISMLEHAAASIAEDIESYSLSAGEVRAYFSALEKVRKLRDGA